MTGDSRRLVSTLLGVAGALFLLLGSFALYARQEIFDSESFSRTATSTLSDESVRSALAHPIVEQVIDLGPDQLINVQPLVEGAVEGALETDAFRSVFRDAVRNAHRALFDSDRDQLVLTLKDLNAVIVGAAQAVDPKLAKQIPDDVGTRLVRVTDSEAALTAARWADRARFLGLVLPPLGILLLAGSVWLAPERRRALVNCMIGLAAAGAVGFISLLVARTLLLRKVGSDTTQDAVKAVYDAFMGGLADWFLLGGVVAVALAAAAAATEAQPLERPRRVIAWFGKVPDSTWARVVRALLVGLAGIVAFLEPLLAIKIAAVGAGAVAVYYAVVELIAAIAPAPASPPARKGRARGARAAAQDVNWRAPAAAAITIVAAAVAVAFLITDEEERKAQRPAGPVENCNGYPELCDRALDDVAFPSTHNAMSAGELPGWFAPNQRRGIPRQLRDGVRGFLIDTHYGVKRSSGPVLTDLTREDESKVNEAVKEQLGPEGAQRFRALQDQFANRGGEATRGVYLCHVVCELGSTQLSKALTWFKDFLDTHPDEVIVLFVEDAVSPADTAEIFEQSGILRYSYVHRPGRPFPTMRELIENDKRLFVMAERDGGRGKYPWFHEGFDLTQETPYTYHSVAELADYDYSCSPNRGEDGNPLFQLNHWVEQIPRSPSTAAKVNAFDFLEPGARECRRRRGLLPNLVAVDYYDQGNLFGVTRVLNGLARDEAPSYRTTG